MPAYPPTNWLGLEPLPDLIPTLTQAEQQALAGRQAYYQAHRWARVAECQERLSRLVSPFDLIFSRVGGHPTEYRVALNILMTEMHRCQTPWWTWPEAHWCQLLQPSRAAFGQCHGHSDRHDGPAGRLLLLACAYLPGNFGAFAHVGQFAQVAFARRVFGTEPLQTAIQRVAAEMKRMGLGASLIKYTMHTVVAYALLLARSPNLGDLSAGLLERVRSEMAPSFRKVCVPLSRTLCRLGILAQPLSPARMGAHPRSGINDTVPVEWLAWCDRWLAASTQAPKTRKAKFTILMKVGRWLATHYPEVTSPEQWARDLAAQWVAAVDRMTVGDWIHPASHLPPRLFGKPIMPNTKATFLATLRTFFIDCQQWGWIPTRFDPRRSIITPRSVQALRGPNPRVIADAVWAKLIGAGLSLTKADLPATVHRIRRKGLPPEGYAEVRPQPWYPLELVRALTLTWLFGGLRSDEIKRLRVGCIRWQAPDPSSTANLPHERPITPDRVCLLEVPVHKTGTAFVKPVDRLVGEAINAWEQIRPPAVAGWDMKTGESVQFLFVYRGKRIGQSYINDTIIPMLCRKAGVPEADTRGPITSHRARPTIATQLYNAREPMNLFELQAWLGHYSPESTQHYVKITPTKLAEAYQDAGYFDRNVRMIEVLLDQEAIQSGAAANGEPWKYYDMGHGYCTYDFFDQCPHRMACAKCSFYRPKTSAKGQLLEGKTHLQRMLQAIPLLDDERAAVEDTVGAMDALLQRLADVPTPDNGQSTTTLIPLPVITHQTSVE